MTLLPDPPTAASEADGGGDGQADGQAEDYGDEGDPAPRVLARSHELTARQDRYWPEPLIQINPSYRRSIDVGALVRSGVIEPACADIFQDADAPLSFYKHQQQAIAHAADGESLVVTTGSGSGKSLCFFIPIVNHVLAPRRAGGHEPCYLIGAASMSLGAGEDALPR